MKCSGVLSIAALLFLLFTANHLFADEIRLKNGDRLSGKVVTMENGKLVFKTSYAGDLTINWAEVESLKTDEPVSIVLIDETAIKGATRTAEPGKLHIETETIDAALRLSEVTAINPEPVPPVKLKVKVNGGLDVEKGNTDNEKYNLDSEFIARTKKNRFTVRGELSYERSDGEKSADNWMGFAKYDHFITDQWYIFGSSFFEKDDFKDLNLRSQFGAGVGYQIFETPEIDLSAETGLSYVNEDYIEAEDNDYSAGTWAVNYEQWFLDKTFQLFHRHMGNVSLEDTTDTFVKTRTGLRIPVYKRFNVGAQFNWDWDNNPSPGEKKGDYRYLLTMGWYYD